MARKKNRQKTEVNSGSTADIAFLLLIFFLVTTTIASEKGLFLKLPPKQDNQEQDIKKKEKNLFNINANSADRVLVEKEPWEKSLDDLVPKIQEFLLNNGRNPELSDSPKDAVVSVKVNRGTSYELYIEILDVVNRAYNEIYASRVGITAEQFRNLDLKNPADKDKYDRARKNFPRQISIAEPGK
ncbi:MAG: biopolymer transporter ExbD [Cytophagales bacterium]|nr:biopolymer transporter ExbD [Cytophagales bacterium]